MKKTVIANSNKRHFLKTDFICLVKPSMDLSQLGDPTSDSAVSQTLSPYSCPWLKLTLAMNGNVRFSKYWCISEADNIDCTCTISLNLKIL